MLNEIRNEAMAKAGFKLNGHMNRVNRNYSRAFAGLPPAKMVEIPEIGMSFYPAALNIMEDSYDSWEIIAWAEHYLGLDTARAELLAAVVREREAAKLRQKAIQRLTKQR